MAFALRGIWFDGSGLGGANGVCPYGVVVDEFDGRWIRPYIVASAGAFLRVWHAIDRLHLLGYLERVSWSYAIDIPENGLIIRPDVGDVLRYSQRDGRRPAR